MIHFFTSAASNYLPKVRLLCNSIKKYHPEVTVHLALPDRKPNWLDLNNEPFDNIITVEELDIPNLKPWMFGHTLVELSTAIKPFVVRKLLSFENSEAVLYFDPDMVLFSRLDDLLDIFKTHSIGLTPHQTKPEKSIEAIMDNEISSLRYGVYNLGFVAVKNDLNGNAFAKWWSERLYEFCREGLNQGLWTDQKWIDLAPAFFEGVKVLKSSRFNVAAWNITTRKMEGSLENGLIIDGEPLGFYHFSGWDSGAHKVMASKYQGTNRALMSLLEWYEKAETQDPITSSTPWAFGFFDNNEKITKQHRLIYRLRPDLQKAYQNPYQVSEGQCYFNWFNWQAHLEHPELVGNIENQGISTENLISSYRQGAIDWNLIKRYLKRAIFDYKYGYKLSIKTIDIIKKSGIKGLSGKVRKMSK
ncbi:hypothetical protein SD70_24655 [Gordoniibacillus kamchatkensis]|uniref:Glycosyl transferase n=1 Tax=Gordoniibacillus kamchatkensis TaxID=1590651 RepID=A0ABR5AD05_9BACL|nr:hypothetical protein [Paenibacillus sp. VKM B-2647]KIL38723.1 hypothetical protein SD70_24655 [Paenibacillus sp. VKM B-2647]